MDNSQSWPKERISESFGQGRMAEEAEGDLSPASSARHLARDYIVSYESRLVGFILFIQQYQRPVFDKSPIVTFSNSSPALSKPSFSGSSIPFYKKETHLSVTVITRLS